MTINVVNVELLNNKLLRNEQRDLCHVLAFVVKHPNCRTATADAEYTVGKGSMTFFRNKIWWVLDRLSIITDEMFKRGLITLDRQEELLEKYETLVMDKVNDLEMAGLMNDWHVTQEDIQLCMEKAVMFRLEKVACVDEVPVPLSLDELDELHGDKYHPNDNEREALWEESEWVDDDEVPVTETPKAVNYDPTPASDENYALSAEPVQKPEPVKPAFLSSWNSFVWKA